MLRQHPAVAPFDSNMQRARFWFRVGRGFRLLVQSSIAVALILTAMSAAAVDLPAPGDLERQSGARPQSLTVIEPHESVGGKRVIVAYSGFPIAALLTDWFGERWRMPSAEIVFEAADGYRSVLGGPRLAGHHALLATKRDDGLPFVVDNPAQHQQRVPLGPYYLVWDNLDDLHLQALGTQGWPYQVVRISLQDAAEEARLIPIGASETAKSGFAATKDHCLSCHRIRGVGGNKFPVPLEQTLCQWSDTDLASFIADPGRFRPGSTMPALDGGNDPAARADVIGRMVTYLAAIRAADSACSNESPPATK